MRITSFPSILSAAALIALSACTVKSVEQPPLAGPSTFAHSIVMVAERNQLTQNGVDFTDIRITSTGPNGQPENIPLRAQIFVDGVAQDFGTLSTKAPITPATIRYTAPAASTLAAGQVPTTVTLVVTPSTNGDFRGEMIRQLDIQLLPQGIILPTNPNLAANFTVTPTSPMAFENATLDASTSTNGGVACLAACTYSWNFGDGTTGTGLTTTHQFRTVGNTVVTLTATDFRGAQATFARTVLIQPPAPPTGDFDFTPSSGIGVNQDVFFSASRMTPAAGRTLVSYAWDFGDGSTGSGVTARHRYSTQGTFTVLLKVTDDVGATVTIPKPLTVLEGLPVVTMTVLPSAPRINQPVTVNVTATPSGAATIASYKFNWGDGSEETSTNPTQTHVYGGTGTVVVAVTVTDSLGRFRTVTQSVTIAP